MSEQPNASPAASGGSAAGASSNGATSAAATVPATTPAAPAAVKKVAEQNPALKAMGLPRFRLPSRNWMIFWAVTGSIASAVIYDKWQTKRAREKWCNLVSHLADEPLETKHMPRRLTVYLAAPPGDGLRSAREHFHAYVKPVLVAAAMDWDVVEGRKEGDVRHKTAEKIRKRRKRNGEGEPLAGEEAEKEAASAEAVRERSQVHDYPGVAGDIIIGRHTWIEYMRGLHEGYLGPPDDPQPKEVEPIVAEELSSQHTPGQSSIGDAAVKAATKVVAENTNPVSTLQTVVDDASPTAETAASDEVLSSDKPSDDAAAKKDEKKKEEEEKPKRRFPPSYILPENYATATPTPITPEIIGPSIGIRFPHLLGIRNTPIRLYRFFTRRHLADAVGREVASAVLAAHRPYDTVTAETDESRTSASAAYATAEVPEQKEVLRIEEKDWWKTVRRVREEHEESVWIEPMHFDERILSRMRTFVMTAEDEDRAKRLGNGTEQPRKRDDEE